jgi:hypothetical protein
MPVQHPTDTARFEATPHNLPRTEIDSREMQRGRTEGGGPTRALGLTEVTACVLVAMGDGPCGPG